MTSRHPLCSLPVRPLSDPKVTSSILVGQAAKKNHMENTCFVCGVDRFTFDTKGGGFDDHIRNDHWM